MRPLIFTCPTTNSSVQHWVDRDDDITEDVYEGVVCSGCGQPHFINRRTGKVFEATRRGPKSN
jgi:hypothetical protein